jgi:hypothetical protein
MGTRERADLVDLEVIHRLTALAHTAVSEGRTEEGLRLMSSVLDRTSGVAEDPEQAKDIEHDVVNAMAVEVLRVHTALRRST